MWWRYRAIFAIFRKKLQNALERHHVIADFYPIYFWNQYHHSFQMSYHKDLADAYLILVKLRGRPKNA